MEKLSRTDVANIKRLDAVAEKPRKKKRILDKKILELQTELNVTEGEIKFWEEQIEKISGINYIDTMNFINGKFSEGIVLTGIQKEGIDANDPTIPENEAGASVNTTEQNIF